MEEWKGGRVEGWGGSPGLCLGRGRLSQRQNERGERGAMLRAALGERSESLRREAPAASPLEGALKPR